MYQYIRHCCHPFVIRWKYNTLKFDGGVLYQTYTCTGTYSTIESGMASIYCVRYILSFVPNHIVFSHNSCTICSTLALYRTGSYKPVLLRGTKERRSVILFLLNFDGGFVIHVQVRTSVQPSFCNTLKI